MAFKFPFSGAAPAAAVLLQVAVGVMVRSDMQAAQQLGVGASLAEAQAAASGLAAIQLGPATSSARLHHLLSTLDKFHDFALGSRRGVQDRHRAVELRLARSMNMTGDEGVRFALHQSRKANEAAFRETEKVYDNMLSFTDSMSSFLMAANSKGRSCEEGMCGPHASCTDTTAGAQCVCKEGYVGLGHDCHPPTDFIPRRVLYQGEAGVQTNAHGVHVCVFALNTIAIVFVDSAHANIGRMVVGTVREAGLADLSPPSQINQPGSEVYDPVVAGSQDRRILVAWRDQDKNAGAFMRGGVLGTTGIRGASMAITWGAQELFTTLQAHKMALVAFDANRFALLYADNVPATLHTPTEHFGNSILVGVGRAGAVTSIGQHRFCGFPIVRLEVTKVAPNAFVVAGRGAKIVDDMNSSRTRNQEAVAIYGELVDDTLVFDPNALSLEPNSTNIWARGLSLIAPNTFAYAYQHGADAMKMAVVEINPETHSMKIVQPPVALRNSFSPYVSMLSVPYTASNPHTLTLYESNSKSMVNVCSWDKEHRNLSRCEDFTWLSHPLSSASGVHLGGGRAFMAFSTREGTPYYSVFGLAKK